MPSTPTNGNSSTPGQQAQSQPQSASAESILIAVLCVLVFVFLLCLALITRWKRSGNNKSKVSLYDLLGMGRVLGTSSAATLDTSSTPKSNQNAKKPKEAAKNNTFPRSMPMPATPTSKTEKGGAITKQNDLESGTLRPQLSNKPQQSKQQPRPTSVNSSALTSAYQSRLYLPLAAATHSRVHLETKAETLERQKKAKNQQQKSIYSNASSNPLVNRAPPAEQPAIENKHYHQERKYSEYWMDSNTQSVVTDSMYSLSGYVDEAADDAKIDHVAAKQQYDPQSSSRHSINRPLHTLEVHNSTSSGSLDSAINLPKQHLQQRDLIDYPKPQVEQTYIPSLGRKGMLDVIKNKAPPPQPIEKDSQLPSTLALESSGQDDLKDDGGFVYPSSDSITVAAADHGASGAAIAPIPSLARKKMGMLNILERRLKE